MTEQALQECLACGQMKPDVIDGYCDDCDRQWPYCTICKERMHVDNTCRHLWYDEESAIVMGSWQDDPDVKESLFALLRRIRHARGIRKTILAKKFKLTYRAYMVGGPEDWECYLVTGASIGRSITYNRRGRIISDETVERDKSGVRWLASVRENEVPWLNELTVQWIDEFLATREKRQRKINEPNSEARAQAATGIDQAAGGRAAQSGQDPPAADPRRVRRTDYTTR
ncbi:MAG TPA: hypothetical protein VM487_17270 [Phycisphaerae bacterium]|nr:hypothetical protein [Phycisphaerae bacterium]HUW34211.1 hypothetical protein [Planctomycetota bacterium]